MNKILKISFFTIGSFYCCHDLQDKPCGCVDDPITYTAQIFGILVKTNSGYEIFSDSLGILCPCNPIDSGFSSDFTPILFSGNLKSNCKKIGGEFMYSPIQISNMTQYDKGYDKLDITLIIIKSENYGYDAGYGYFINDNRSPYGTRILNATKGQCGGFIPFETQEDAYLAGLLEIYSLRTAKSSVNCEVIKYIESLH
jgi:hypothetical protein